MTKHKAGSSLTAKHNRKAPPLAKGDVNTNPADISFWSLIAEDFRANGSSLWAQGFWVIFTHRFGNWRMDVKPKILRLPLTVIYRIIHKLNQIVCGIQLDYSVPVGRRVHLLHFGGMLLGPRSIGNDVVLKQNTTLGSSDEGDVNARPVIEDHVEIGPGAVIVGDITIGHHSKIGPNAVVITDIPPYSVAFGVPARVIMKTQKDKGEIAV
ncbi:MAG: transferase [bacterium]|nr:transferase [bacterium]